MSNCGSCDAPGIASNSSDLTSWGQSEIGVQLAREAIEEVSQSESPADAAVRVADRRLAHSQVSSRRWSYVFFLLLGLLILPWILNRPFYLNLLILIFLYITLAHAWNILAGYAGQVSLGQQVFFAVGAYTSTLLYVRAGISPWLGILAALVIALAAAIVIGYPTFKLKQDYFTIATLLVSEIVSVLVLNWKWAGAASGIYIPFHTPSFAAMQFNTKLPYYYVALGLSVISTITVFWMERSRLGYYFRAIKDEAEAAQMLGIDITYYKVVAMVLHACLVAPAGVFYAQYVLFIAPDSVLNITPTVLTMLAVIIGGIGTLVGPILGVLVMVPLSEFTRVYLGGSGRAIDLVIYGALAVILGIIQPQGLIRIRGLFDRLADGRER
jgi:branched-chain amino acid transport system permease protein